MDGPAKKATLTSIDKMIAELEDSTPLLSSTARRALSSRLGSDRRGEAQSPLP